MITNVKKNKSTPIKIKGKRKISILANTHRTRDFFNGF